VGHGDNEEGTEGRGAGVRSALDDAEELGLAEDQVLVVLDLDFGAGVLAVYHGVADLDAHLGALAVVEALAGADGDDLAADGLLLRGLGQVDARRGAGLGLDGLDKDAVFEWFDGHCCFAPKYR
jgi:hypothetical protein